ncbi:MAG: hypothetical protein IPI43_11695 [Sandaracinaceae bacterium]|nr:hypothetical protein [Sandaracinaceae bacterium]
MSEFTAPLSRFATHFIERWVFEPTPTGCRVVRSFELHPRTWWGAAAPADRATHAPRGGPPPARHERWAIGRTAGCRRVTRIRASQANAARERRQTAP